jgi:hypothetical protein
MQAAFFETPEHQLVNGQSLRSHVYQGIQVCMLNFELNQPPFWGV